MTTFIDLKLDILKQEIELINNKINHFDILRSRIRRLTILIWTASIGVSIYQKMPKLLLLAIFIPIPLWIIESYYHAYQEGFLLRLGAIKKFIQTGHYKVRGQLNVDLEKCLLSDNLGNFPVPDYYGNYTIEEEIHKKETNVLNNFKKFKMILFYAPLILIATILLLIV